MSATEVHALAEVHPKAKVGKNVVIEPYAVIKEGVTLEDGVRIKSFAYIDGDTTIGEGTVVYPGANIGNPPQALKYQGEPTFIRIGKQCQIREHVTINLSLGEGNGVTIGDHCFLMAYAHVAHNCSIADHAILSNNVALAGHVDVEEYAIIGGLTPIHQRCRIGRHAMVGGLSRVNQDVPPFVLGGGVPFKLGGLNLVGLKRRGFSLETRQALSRAFRILYRSGLRVEEALDSIVEQLGECPEITDFVRFCRATERGLIGLEGKH